MNEFLKKKVLKELSKKGINKFIALEIVETINADTYNGCINQINYAITLIFDSTHINIASK